MAAVQPLYQFKTPSTFCGTSKENATDWIDRFERIGKHNRWSNDDLSRIIDVCLEGAAFKWILKLESKETRPGHWEDRGDTQGLKSLFLKQFAADDMKRSTERRLRARVQQSNEDIAEYYHDVVDMCRIVQRDMSDETIVDHLLRGG